MRNLAILEINFDYGILESMKYSHRPTDTNIDIMEYISDDEVEELEDLFWGKNPITFTKFLPFKLKECSEKLGIKMFDCLDVFVKEQGTKYHYRFRQNKLI